ncbi:MAG: SusC/RagA family TonB-linked outer membrane protein, partial [Pedobacter sp.]
MKSLYSILLFLSISMQLLLSGNTSAQNTSEPKISINIKNQNLKTALSIIQKESGMQVIYNENLIANYRSIDLVANKQSLATVLENLLRNTALKYYLQGNKIVIVSRQSDSAAKQVGNINGRITDELGEPLPGATIKVLEMNSSVSSDNNGVFSIGVGAGTYTLEISYLSYRSKIVNNLKASNKAVAISLVPNSQLLENVVVTALGIKREEKSLGYAISTVDGEEIAK